MRLPWLDNRLADRFSTRRGILPVRPARKTRRSFRPGLVPLEDRIALSTFQVTSAADNGNNANPIAGSLRWAVVTANKQGGSNTIDFKIGRGYQTISLLAPLPTLKGTTTLDGSTQPGYSYSGSPLIVINGASAGSKSIGIDVAASNCAIRDLVIEQFTTGIELESGTRGAVIQGNYIGTDPYGTYSLGNYDGIVDNSLGGNTIGGTSPWYRNVISGNSNAGIQIQPTIYYVPFSTVSTNIIVVGPGPIKTPQPPHQTPDLVEGNYIGTTASGNSALGNGTGLATSTAVVIGGSTSGARNVISGNSGAGIAVNSVSSSSLVIAGNSIGTSASGNGYVSNGDGISLYYDSYVTIGGTSSGYRNVISGNEGAGIDIEYCSNVYVEGNSIGTNASGNYPLGNFDGILMYSDTVRVHGPYDDCRGPRSFLRTLERAGTEEIIGLVRSGRATFCTSKDSQINISYRAKKAYASS
jgi:hypothetical protein